MRLIIYFILGTVLLIWSCDGKNKHLGKNKMPVAENITPKIEEKTVPDIANPIKEVEEKLVANNNNLPNPHHYFVIIGSFRNPENVKKYQIQIFKEGFNSEILKNEAGLYRVSVMSTDEIEPAREDIRRIRRVFPEYLDTWSLIQKK